MMKQWITTCVLCLNALAVHADDAHKVAEARDPELRHEFLQRRNVDQEVRIASMNFCKTHAIRDISDTDSLSAQQKAELEVLSARFKKVDNENTHWLKEVVEKHGWPTRTLVGVDGANAAWILVQHADADPQFQRHCLDLMSKCPREEVSQENFAYLTDRVLLAEGKKQKYGTQLVWVDRKFQPRPIEDEANVDKIRAAVGLPPLAEYLELAEQVYGGSSK
jgi:hypothetical protein